MASGNDMNRAQETYAGFITMAKVGSVVVALVTAFVVFLIASSS
ncbi:MAG TPA: aa3-type cytochrome c oxidase subunit IV [Novosphingobium sp.]|nr:aa3-type cytochrome c oxidase subunit IV [Novosphingobium sp.]